MDLFIDLSPSLSRPTWQAGTEMAVLANPRHDCLLHTRAVGLTSMELRRAKDGNLVFDYGNGRKLGGLPVAAPCMEKSPSNSYSADTGDFYTQPFWFYIHVNLLVWVRPHA